MKNELNKEFIERNMVHPEAIWEFRKFVSKHKINPCQMRRLLYWFANEWNNPWDIVTELESIAWLKTKIIDDKIPFEVLKDTIKLNEGEMLDAFCVGMIDQLEDLELNAPYR